MNGSGATQSGMIGYFHDKTINLDGKVDPEALKANMNNNITDYILKRKVDYLIDLSILDSQEIAKIKKYYDLIVEDIPKNLVIFKRNDLHEQPLK